MKQADKTLLVLAIASICSSSVSADTVRDSLKNGTFSAEIRNVVVQSSYTDAIGEAGVTNNNNSGGTAISIKYETAPYSGLKFGIAFQHGQDWGLQDESTGLSIAGGEDEHRVSITSTSLEQAYIDYAFKKETSNTSIRLGRQKIVSPLIMNSGVFPMKDTFDAVVITNKDLPDTTLKLMYIDSWIMRYGDAASASPTQNDIHYENPLYSLYLNNNSLAGLNIEGQWLINDNDSKAGDPPTAAVTADGYQTGFLGLTYKIPQTSWVIGAKALTADYDTLSDTGYWGVKAQTKLGDYTVKLAYTDVDDDRNFPGTLGHVPMFRAYHSTVTSEIFAGLKTTSLSVSSGFGIPGFSSGITYAMWDQSATGMANSGKNFDGGSELALDLKYKFKTFEGLSSRIQLSQMDYDQAGDDDQTYLRATLNYAF